MEESRRLGYEGVRPLLDRLLDLLRARLGEQLLAVALYGSLARGQGRPTSDMDLLIVYRGDRMAVFDQFMDMLLYDLKDTLEWMELRREGLKPDPYPVFFNEAELADTPWLLLDIQDHGIILYDPHAILQRKFENLRRRLRELGSRKVVLRDGSWYWDLKPDWKPGEVIEL
jgi:predicted nucleotidyltransferase